MVGGGGCVSKKRPGQAVGEEGTVREPLTVPLGSESPE